MNISLPEALKAFVDAQVAERGYSTSSEYVREFDPQGPGAPAPPRDPVGRR